MIKPMAVTFCIIEGFSFLKLCKCSRILHISPRVTLLWVMCVAFENTCSFRKVKCLQGYFKTISIRIYFMLPWWWCGCYDCGFPITQPEFDFQGSKSLWHIQIKNWMSVSIKLTLFQENWFVHAGNREVC